VRGEDYSIYVCPTCRAALALDGDELRCAAGHAFPIRGGVPRFVTDEGYAASFGYQWKQFSRAQLDSETGTDASRRRLLLGTGWPERLDGETVLEAGCGMGRFTEVLLSTGATVVSFDYSAAAEVTHEQFSSRGARVCQASIYELPYRPASFDRVFCYGVLQHCPDVERAFHSLVQAVKPGGHLAVDVYDRLRMFFNARYRVRWLTRRVPKETLLRWCQRLVPAYMRVVPPLHPFNQLVVPIKDYRGRLGMAREHEIEWSVLDTMDALSPAYDQPQWLSTMKRWCRDAGLIDVWAKRGGNGIEVRARRPA